MRPWHDIDFYGGFSKTLASDKDGLNVFVFSKAPILSLTFLEVRP